MTEKSRTYSPDGVNGKLVGVRFTPKERAIIEQKARAENKTISHVVRILSLKGLNSEDGVQHVS